MKILLLLLVFSFQSGAYALTGCESFLKDECNVSGSLETTIFSKGSDATLCVRYTFDQCFAPFGSTEGAVVTNNLRYSWNVQVSHKFKCGAAQSPDDCKRAVVDTCFTLHPGTEQDTCFSNTIDTFLANEGGGGGFDDGAAKITCADIVGDEPLFSSCVGYLSTLCKDSRDQSEFDTCAADRDKKDNIFAFKNSTDQSCKVVLTELEQINTCNYTAMFVCAGDSRCVEVIAYGILNGEGGGGTFDDKAASDICGEQSPRYVSSCVKTVNDKCAAVPGTDQVKYDDCVNGLAKVLNEGCASIFDKSTPEFDSCFTQAGASCPLPTGEVLVACATAIGENIRDAAANASYASSCTSTYCIYAECWSNGVKPVPTAVGDVCACKDNGGVKRYFKGDWIKAVDFTASGSCTEGTTAVSPVASGGGCSFAAGSYAAECKDGKTIQGIAIGAGDSACSCNGSSLKRYLTGDTTIISSATYAHAYTCNDGFRVESSLETRDIITNACDGHGGLKAVRIVDSNGNTVANVTYSSSSSSTTGGSTSGSVTPTTGGTSGGTTGKDSGDTTGGTTGKDSGDTTGGTTGKDSGDTTGGTTGGGSTTGPDVPSTGGSSGGTTGKVTG